MSFLTDVSTHSAENSMDMENLSRIFAPTLMRPADGPGGTGGRASPPTAAGGSSSMEAMQLDLIKAAAELNLCKVAVDLMLQRALRCKQVLLERGGADGAGAAEAAAPQDLREIEAEVVAGLNDKMLQRMERMGMGVSGRGGR